MYTVSQDIFNLSIHVTISYDLLYVGPFRQDAYDQGQDEPDSM